MRSLSRRTLLAGASAAAAGVAMGPWVRRSHAQGGPIKIGLVLPYTGVYELGKFAGLQLGLRHERLPRRLVSRLSAFAVEEGRARRAGAPAD